MEKMKKMTNRLIELANANVVLFHTADKVAWLTIKQGGHEENWGLRDPIFRRFLMSLYYENEGTPPNDAALKSALDILEHEALVSNEEIIIHQRIARLPDKIVIDLSNDAWQAVEVTVDGWNVVGTPCVRFRRTPNTGALPMPERGGNFNDLRPLLSTDDHNFTLLRGVVLDAFKGRGPYMAMIVTGEQGSAKSWLCRFYRMVVDPLRKAPLSSLPREEKDLGVDALNEHLLVYDHVSYLPQWLSDALCRVLVCNPVCLNGIPDFVESNDLLGRAVIIRLPYISDDERIEEETLMAGFAKVKGSVFGGILDDLVCGLKNIGTTNLPKLPRMADSAKWVTACLGNENFLDAYRDNIAEAAELADDDNNAS